MGFCSPPPLLRRTVTSTLLKWLQFGPEQSKVQVEGHTHNPCIRAYNPQFGNTFIFLLVILNSINVHITGFQHCCEASNLDFKVLSRYIYHLPSGQQAVVTIKAILPQMVQIYLFMINNATFSKLQ